MYMIAYPYLHDREVYMRRTLRKQLAAVMLTVAMLVSLTGIAEKTQRMKITSSALIKGSKVKFPKSTLMKIWN